PGCTYATGIARAEKLLGPWEKYPGNPVMTNNDEWKCPGHGTPVEKEGRHYFMLHAYDREDGVFAGRQGVLQEFTFTDDGWITFKEEQIADAAIPENVREDFSSGVLGPDWQWSVFTPVNYRVKGQLSLDARTGTAGAFLGHKTLTGDYQAEITYLPKMSTASGGFGLIGDEQNFIIARIDRNKLSLVRMEKGKEIILKEQPLKGTEPIRLRVDVQQGKNINFQYKAGKGSFVTLNPQPLNGELLPPWDRAIRICVMAKGTTTQKAEYDDFVLINK
ncbi:MAG TPA: family 43 glycosylhydrolase, partial [Ohtaekwangia sp.]|nr:family 43 glycosylhydrolase [Ohtaekwangia sp.]